MLITFQIILMILTVLYSLLTVSSEPTEARNRYLSIALASIVSLVITFAL